MKNLSETCPHCYTENVYFGFLHSCRILDNPGSLLAAFQCGNCGGGLMATVGGSLKYGSQNLESHFNKFAGDMRNSERLQIIDTYPKPSEPEAPAHTPDDVKALYLQSASSIRRMEYDTGAMGCRRALDLALKVFDPEGKGDLNKRIKALATKQIITAQLGEWAHAIRLDGNEATHGDNLVAEEDAKALLSFVELFLMYTFTLPGMLDERRAMTAKPE